MNYFKPFIVVTSVLLMTGLSAQQTGTITYSEITKLEFEGIEGMDLGDMLPSEMNFKKALYFDKMISVYRDAEDSEEPEDVEMESEDGSFKMVIETSSSSEEILYTNLNEKKNLYQTGFMSKDFLIESDIDNPKWKITNERIKYLGYVCQKATMTETISATPGTDDAPKEVDVVAWFKSEIPVPLGPKRYNQLPGAILLLSVDEGKTEIRATEVDLGQPKPSFLVKPTNGQKVSQDEYDVIVARKLKEFQDMNNGRGGRSIQIRG